VFTPVSFSFALVTGDHRSNWYVNHWGKH